MSARDKAALAAVTSYARKGDAQYAMSLFRLISSAQKESN